MHPFLCTISVFWQLMCRDLFVHKKDFIDHMINSVIISPILFGFSFAYIQKTVYFGESTAAAQQGTIMFIGSMIIPILVVSYKILAELLFDLEGSKFISYQMTILNPRLILLQRIIFASIYTSILTLPFLPIASLIVGKHLDLQAINWFSFNVVIVASVFCCASYNMFALTLLKIENLKSFWIRVNWPLINLGGFWVPLIVINKFSSTLGTLALLSPVTYMLEGLRSAATGSSVFISANICCGILMLFTSICIGLSFISFKRRVDHI